MNKKVAVIGDAMLDVYQSGISMRLSPEAPVPVVLNPNERFFLGGAAHVVQLLYAAGIPVDFYCGIADDRSGKQLRELLNPICQLRTIKTSITTTKTRIQVEGHQVCRIDREDPTDFSRELLDLFNGSGQEYSAVVVSDYSKGAVSSTSCIQNTKTFIDPKGTFLENYSGSFLIKPNSTEYLKLFGKHYSPGDNKVIAQKIADLDIENLLLTRSHLPAILVKKSGEVKEFHFEVSDVNDVTGAGDVVLSGIVSSYVSGLDLDECVSIGIKRSTESVRHHGTGFGEQQRDPSFEKHYFVDMKDVLKLKKSLDEKGKKLVITNGCFDLLHPGHLQTLRYAKQQGDYLLVLINSDESVRTLKGEHRPINNESVRGAMLLGTVDVDGVLVFSESTPGLVIDQLIPAVLVKGGDYSPEEVVGYETVMRNGGKVLVAPFLEGHSTTAIIEKQSKK